jgi:hypothetical protein
VGSRARPVGVPLNREQHARLLASMRRRESKSAALIRALLQAAELPLGPTPAPPHPKEANERIFHVTAYLGPIEQEVLRRLCLKTRLLEAQAMRLAIERTTR